MMELKLNICWNLHRTNPEAKKITESSRQGRKCKEEKDAWRSL